MFILLIVLFLSCYGGIFCSTCSSVKDCITCVSKDSWHPLVSLNCRWCSLSRQCHAYGSLFNPCPFGGSVSTTSECYNKQYGVYSPEDAYINALLSAVAYSDHPQKCMDKLLPRGGFQLIKAIGMECDNFLFDYSECYAIIVVSDYSKLIVVAYRGSSSIQQLLDQALTTSIFPKQEFKSGGHVQKYFDDAFQKLYPCAIQYLKTLTSLRPDYDVVITGHSLGAAMASLMAVSLIYDKIIPANKMSLYTFGMPRVGDKRYAIAHDLLVNNSWRVVHYNDVVARLPPRINIFLDNQPYHHKTEIYYPGGGMFPNSTYKKCASNEDPTCVNSNTVNTDSFFYHTNYFNISLGWECLNIGARRRRSADGRELSAMWGQFSNETCKLADVSGSKKNTNHNYPLLIILLYIGLLV